MIGELGAVKESIGKGAIYQQGCELVIGIGRRVLVMRLQDGKVAVAPFEPAALGYSKNQDKEDRVEMSIVLLQAQTIGLRIIIVVCMAVLFVIFLLASAVRIVQEYERGVIFRLGRVLGRAKGPGLFFLIPIADRMVKVQLRTVSLAVPPQEVARSRL